MSQINFSLLTYFSLCFPNYFGNIKKGKTACILCRISRQLRKENNRTLYFCCSFLDVKCPPYLANAIFSIAHPPHPQHLSSTICPISWEWCEWLYREKRLSLYSIPVYRAHFFQGITITADV